MDRDEHARHRVSLSKGPGAVRKGAGSVHVPKSRQRGDSADCPERMPAVAGFQSGAEQSAIEDASRLF